jgi:glycosyltransferase involved in cell wall biosynthesis
VTPSTSASETPAEVTVYIASADTAACTELTVRTALARAGMAHSLVVGDGGSTDGSIEMLTALRDRGLLRLEASDGPRHHSAWLDHWLATCGTRWAVFVDSDVEFHHGDWLREIVDVARQGDYALVCSDMLPATPHTIEPVGGNEVYLAPRPAPWLMLVDCARVRALGVSFRFVGEVSADRPEGLIAYDTGAKLFAALQDAGLAWKQMPACFARGYTHFGNMSWADKLGAGRAHRAKLRRVRRRLRRARRSDRR